MSEFEYRIYTKGCSLKSAVFMFDDPKHLYVAAAYHEEGFIPGFFDPVTETCEVPWHYSSHVKEEFYILYMKSGSYLWTPDIMGNVPLSAIKGGVSEKGETLYIGKFKFHDRYICGKISPSHGGCFVCSDGLERSSTSYFVLSSEDDNPITTFPTNWEPER